MHIELNSELLGLTDRAQRSNGRVIYLRSGIVVDIMMQTNTRLQRQDNNFNSLPFTTINLIQAYNGTVSMYINLQRLSSSRINATFLSRHQEVKFLI